MVQTRGPTGSLRRVTIGRDVKVTAEAARRTAAEVIDRIRSGEDPFPAPPTPEPTVADLAERYMKAHVEVNCRPGTVGIFRRVLDLYILPELGALRISAVERSHVSDLHFKMRDKPYQANQTISVLAKMFNLADKWGWRPSARNPCKGVPRYKVEQHHERYLIGEPGLRIDVVEFGGADQGVHRRRPYTTAVGAGEQPRFSAQGNPPERALSRIVRQADTPVVEEAGETIPALQHKVHGPGHGGMARQPGALRSWRTARRRSAVSPLIVRSMSNSASIRFTASIASGEIGICGASAPPLPAELLI